MGRDGKDQVLLAVSPEYEMGASEHGQRTSGRWAELEGEKGSATPGT